MMIDREEEDEETESALLSLLLLLLLRLFVRATTAAASAGTSKETKSNKSKTRAARPPLRDGQSMARTFSNVIFFSFVDLSTKIKIVAFQVFTEEVSSALSVVVVRSLLLSALSLRGCSFLLLLAKKEKIKNE